MDTNEEALWLRSKRDDEPRRVFYIDTTTPHGGVKKIMELYRKCMDRELLNLDVRI